MNNSFLYVTNIDAYYCALYDNRQNALKEFNAQVITSFKDDTNFSTLSI